MEFHDLERRTPEIVGEIYRNRNLPASLGGVNARQLFLAEQFVTAMDYMACWLLNGAVLQGCSPIQKH